MIETGSRSIENFLSHFNGVKKVSVTEWNCHCPVCEPNGGRSRHLYIGYGTKNPNAITMYCHHFCDNKAILEAVDLKESDLFLDPPKGHSEPNTGRTVDAVATSNAEHREHIYCTAAGQPAFKKVIDKDSNGHKDVHWKTLNTATGRWVGGGKDTPLYNLNRLAESDAKTVFICEGEKDCDTLTRMGLMATTAGACDSWKDRHTEQLKQYADGKTVVVLTDNDLPGRKMGESVSNAIKGAFNEVYVVPTMAYWQNAPEKADITDYVVATTQGMDDADAAEELNNIVMQLREIVLGMRKASEPQPLETLTADKFEVVPHRFLWSPYLPLGQYTVLMADSGTGKSILTCGICAALTTGDPLPTESIEPSEFPEPIDVLIISSEDSGAEYRARLSASGADLSKCHIVDCDASIGLDLIQDSDRIVATAKKFNAHLIVCDPWQAFVGETIDLNRMNQVRPAMQKIAHMARQADASIILISHTNKKSQSENANNAAAGSAELVNASRSAVKVVASDDPNDAKSVRLMVHTKSSYAAIGKTVRYRIVEGGGLEWDGFSDVLKDDLEAAARQHKTVREAMTDKAIKSAERDAKNEERAELTNAIIELSNLGERKNKVRVNISYNEMVDHYGQYIFMNRSPKSALKSVQQQLAECGVDLVHDRSCQYKAPDADKPTNCRGFQVIKRIRLVEPHVEEVRDDD